MPPFREPTAGSSQPGRVTFRNHRPVLITQNGQAKAVLQDIESHEESRKAILLLKLLAPAEIQAARCEAIPMKDVFQRLKKRLR